MTSSDCHIGSLDDIEFNAFLKSVGSEDTEWRQSLPWLPPTPPGTFWNSILVVWARQHDLPVDDVDELTIRVRVSRTQLLRFVDEIFWPKDGGSTYGWRPIIMIKDQEVINRLEILRKHLRERLREDKTYYIEADEF